MQGKNIRIGWDLNQGSHTPKANAVTTELKRILSNAVGRYCIYIGKQPRLKEWSPVTQPLLQA